MAKKWFALATLSLMGGVSLVNSSCTSDDVTTFAVATDGGFPEDAFGISSSSSASGAVTTGTCLDTDPINASTIAYVKASPAVVNACSTSELQTLSDYYKTHGADQTFSAEDWMNTVGRDCAACVFTSDDDAQNPPTSWNPILIKNDQLETVDQGGCIEHVSGNFDCGKAFQQLEACQVDACLVKCNSQKDYDTCRQDTTVLTTSCASAVTTVKTACGPLLANYQSDCNSTNFAFEGPIKIACISPPTPEKDAGAPDASDAGDGGQ